MGSRATKALLALRGLLTSNLKSDKITELRLIHVVRGLVDKGSATDNIHTDTRLLKAFTERL